MMMKKNYRNAVVMLLYILLPCAMLGCGPTHDKAKEKMKTFVAKSEAITTNLYFTSTIEPIDVHAVTAPVTGTVVGKFFAYGSFVGKGDHLFTIHSTDLESKYQQALAQYVKDKQALDDQRTKFEDTKQLWDAKLVARETYQSDRSSLATDQLAVIQSQKKLDAILETVGTANTSVRQFQLIDIKTIEQVLDYDFGKVNIISPASGIALFPPKGTSGTTKAAIGSECDVMIKGCSVKTAQVMVVIGDLKGVSLSFDVSEIDINRLKVGQSVTVTGPAFPGITLKGAIVNINKQAKTGTSFGGGGVVQFPVTVKVPRLTANEQKILHVGMSAKIALEIKNPPRILIPIKAVFEKNGVSMVNIIDPKSKKKETVSIKTGETTLDNVVVSGGIKEGDTVVIP